MAISTETWVQAASFLGAGFSVGFGAIGAALGEGYAAGKASQAIGRNPAMSGAILKNMLIGQAVAESAGIFALVIAMLLCFMDVQGAPMIEAFGLLGSGLAMGLAAIGSGAGGGYPAAEACLGIADNPPTQGALTTNMLIGSAVSQTPAIFGMVVAFMLMFMDWSGQPLWPGWAALLGAGLSVGLAAIGSGVGSGMPAGSSTAGMARQPGAANQIRTNMLIGSAVSQTPAIFGMVVAFMLMFIDWNGQPPSPTWAALLGAGISTGLSAIGPGLGNGFTAQEAAAGVARTPEASGPITTTMLIGQTVAQSTVIYGFLVSLILLFIPRGASESMVAWAAPLSAGICMGFGGIGPGVGEGIAAAYTVNRIARDHQGISVLLTRVMLVGQAVSESTGIYALIVALLLLFVV
ncbi:MAG: ATP synthase F0 subunit C [Desulfarculus sp.]|nr:MAG: ATP synthase F0 subunit C [Desulfarculus sp.]